MNKILQGECSEVMKSLPDCSIDLTVTSPPYDNLRDYKGFSFDFESIAKGLYRLTRDGGVVVWVVGDQTIGGSESGTSFRQALFFKETGFNLHDTMIYDKGKVVYPDPTRYHQTFEYMFVFSKGKPKTINLIEDRKNKWTKSWGKRSFRNKDGSLTKKDPLELKEYGVRNNIWMIQGGHMHSTLDKLAFEHPAIFPEKLAQDHILSWSNSGDLVFDPMCGSGTTLKMAKLLNRKYLGIELSEEYVKIAQKRVDSVTPPLF